MEQRSKPVPAAIATIGASLGIPVLVAMFVVATVPPAEGLGIKPELPEPPPVVAFYADGIRLIELQAIEPGGTGSCRWFAPSPAMVMYAEWVAQRSPVWGDPTGMALLDCLDATRVGFIP